MDYSEDRLVHAVLGSCIAVHREIGPGEDELVYEQALSAALQSRGIQHICQLPLLLHYHGHVLDCGFRRDTMVESRLPFELKSVETLHPIHVAQTLTYMRLCRQPLGFLINFDVPALRLGIRRLRDAVAGGPDLSATPSFNTGDSAIDALLSTACEVHRTLGPGLLRSAYEACLAHELRDRALRHEWQHSAPLSFQGHALTARSAVPLLLDGRVPVTCLSTTKVTPLHVARMLAQLRRAQWPFGFILNFNVTTFVSGIRRVIIEGQLRPPCS